MPVTAGISATTGLAYATAGAGVISGNGLRRGGGAGSEYLVGRHLAGGVVGRGGNCSVRIMTFSSVVRFQSGGFYDE